MSHLRCRRFWLKDFSVSCSLPIGHLSPSKSHGAPSGPRWRVHYHDTLLLQLHADVICCHKVLGGPSCCAGLRTSHRSLVDGTTRITYTHPEWVLQVQWERNCLLYHALGLIKHVVGRLSQFDSSRRQADDVSLGHLDDPAANFEKRVPRERAQET